MKFDIMSVIAVVLAVILFGNVALYNSELGPVNSSTLVITGILLLGLSAWVMIKGKKEHETQNQ